MLGNFFPDYIATIYIPSRWNGVVFYKIPLSSRIPIGAFVLTFTTSCGVLSKITDGVGFV